MKREVLIVDDSMTTLVLLEWFLQEKGFSTTLASDGESALIGLKQNKPDLILLDLELPKISGFDFLKICRNREEYKNIPIIIISAIDTNESKKKAHELGANGFMPKPFNLENIYQKIIEFLGPLD